jgi:hypothetical protein
VTGIHFSDLRLVELPKLQLDNREVIEARLTSPAEWQSMAPTKLVAAYPARRQSRLPPTANLKRHGFATWGCREKLDRRGSTQPKWPSVTAPIRLRFDGRDRPVYSHSGSYFPGLLTIFPIILNG